MIDTSPEGIKAFVEQCRMENKLTDVFAVAADSESAMFDCETVKMLPESRKGNLFKRSMSRMKLGSKHEGERHNFDHLTIVKSGKFLIKQWKKDSEESPLELVKEVQLDEGDELTIPASMWHEITCIAVGKSGEGAFACYYALRDYDGFVTQKWNGSGYPFV